MTNKIQANQIVLDYEDIQDNTIPELTFARILVAAAVPLTTNTPLSLTSISLDAGTYDITGAVGFTPAASTTVSTMTAAVSLIDNSTGSGPGKICDLKPLDNSGQNAIRVTQSFPSLVLGGQYALSIPTTRAVFTAPTTVYLVANAIFAVDTLASFGSIAVRRIGN